MPKASPKKQENMPLIKFKAKLSKINSWIILLLPKNASEKLSSRGIVMVNGKINNFEFQSELEPDGRGSHWFKITKPILDAIHAKVTDTVNVEVQQTKEWPNPIVPPDIKKPLVAEQNLHEAWRSLTPMAKWEWIRWIRGTNEEATRKKRIVVAVSKLKSGMRRPCCFNQSMCTEPYVSKGGKLLEASETASR